jgi:uncharacterized protein with HEPN domain
VIDERIALDLDNMKQAATEAMSFVRDSAEADFLGNKAQQMACAMCLVIVGEATSRIERRSPDFVAAHPDWPWKEIRGLRNRIVHDYTTLDLPTIWVVIRDSLPKLLASIEAIGELDPRLWPEDDPPQIGS